MSTSGNGYDNRTRTEERDSVRGSVYGGSGGYSSSGPMIGGTRIKPLYLYIGIGIVAVVAIVILFQIINAAMIAHFGAIAGALLLLANGRELLGATGSYGQPQQTALLNVLLGASLVLAWIAQLLGALFWIPAWILLVVAAPLAIGRASVYQSYINTARGAMQNARRVMNR